MNLERYLYNEKTSGKEINKEIEISKLDDGFFLITIRDNKNEAEYITDSSFSIVKWKYKNPYNSTDITAERYGNLISIKGQLKNKQCEEKITIDDLAFYQEWSLGLRQFIISVNKKIQFWTINPDDLKAHKFEAKKDKTEEIEVNGQKVEAVYVKLSFAGFLKVFWSGNMWFRKSDGVFVFSSMRNGPPNVPVTTVELIEEKQNKENVI